MSTNEINNKMEQFWERYDCFVEEYTRRAIKVLDEFQYHQEWFRDNKVEVKMEKVKIKNEPDLYVQLPRKNRGFVVEESFGNDHKLKCYRDGCDVTAYCRDDRYFLEKDAHHSHGPGDEIIAAKLHKQKMHDLIENMKKLQKPKKRNWNDSTQSYIQDKITPKVIDFQNNLWQNLGMFSSIVHGQVIETYKKMFEGIAKPFIDSIKSSLQDINLNTIDSLVDVNACKKTLLEVIARTQSSFLHEVDLLYKNVSEAIIPKYMESLQEKLNFLVGNISSILMSVEKSGVSAKKGKS